MAGLKGREPVESNWTMDPVPSRSVGDPERKRSTLDRAYVSYMAYDGPGLEEREAVAAKGVAFLRAVLTEGDFEVLWALTSGEQTQEEMAAERGVSQPTISFKLQRAKRTARGLAVLRTLDPLVWDPERKGWEDLWNRAYSGALRHFQHHAGKSLESLQQARAKAIRHAHIITMYYYTGAEAGLCRDRWDGLSLPANQSSISTVLSKVLRRTGGPYGDALGPVWVRALRAVRSAGRATYVDGKPAWRGGSVTQDPVLSYLREQEVTLSERTP